jgi:DNA repair protein RecO (recombination protein O)
MFIHYRTRGFVLKRRNLGEADQLFTVFTEEFGKLILLAKAVRKIKSKLRGGLKLFSLSEIEFIQGKTYKTLTDARTLKEFPEIKKELRKTTLAFKMAEVLDIFTQVQQKEEKVWNLLIETFRLLDEKQIGKKSRSPFQVGSWKLIYYYFFWSLADFLGFRPQLQNCIFCHGNFKNGPSYFSSEEGGVICGKCSAKIKEGDRITEDLVKILRVILEKNWGKLSRLKMNPKHFQELKKISEKYHNFLLNLSKE